MISGFPSPWTAPGAQPASARAVSYIVTPGYQDALGLRVRQGRLFADGDISSGTRAWVVNEEFARLYLPPQPLGYRFEQQTDDGKRSIEIVGIVANVLKDGNDRKPQPEMYVVARDRAQFGARFELVIRAAGAPASLAPGVRAAVHDALPAAAIETVPLSQRVAESVDQPRFADAVLVAVRRPRARAGVRRAVRRAVVQRVAAAPRARRAGGARARRSRTRSAWSCARASAPRSWGWRPVCVAAALLTRLMQSVLFGVGPLDLVAFAAAPAVLIPIALADVPDSRQSRGARRSDRGVAQRIAIPRRAARRVARTKSSQGATHDVRRPPFLLVTVVAAFVPVRSASAQPAAAAPPPPPPPLWDVQVGAVVRGHLRQLGHRLDRRRLCREPPRKGLEDRIDRVRRSRPAATTRRRPNGISRCCAPSAR